MVLLRLLTLDNNDLIATQDWLVGKKKKKKETNMERFNLMAAASHWPSGA